MANQQDMNKGKDAAWKKGEELRKGDTEAKDTGIKETWPVHAQPGAKDDARIAGKPGATSRD